LIGVDWGCFVMVLVVTECECFEEAMTEPCVIGDFALAEDVL